MFVFVGATACKKSYQQGNTHLPSIIHDLTAAFGESTYQKLGLINEKGLDIYLHDAMSGSFDTSATVTYLPYDTVYYLRLNRFNRHAGDRALAVTLIHEIMHCILIGHQ